MRKHLKDYFIPHEGNGYAPNSLQRFSVGVMFVLALLSFAAANLQSVLWITSDWLVSTILPSVIVDLTNEERDHEVLGQLTRSDVLDRAAQLKADDMVANGYFAHYSPTGVSPWYWFDTVGYTYIHAGENLAVHFTDSSDVVNAWMNSPGHRANILSGKYTEIGVGTAKGEYKGYETVFVVQLFGTPASLAQAPALALQTPIEEVVVDTALEPISEETTPVVASAEATAPEPVEEPGMTMEEVADTTEATMSPVVTESEDVAGDESRELFADIATSSPLALPAGTHTITGGSTPTNGAGWLGLVATAPGVWFQVFYFALAGFVMLTLVLSIVIEWRKQHPVQIAYGVGLMATMALLMIVQNSLVEHVIVL
ncbi:hypothetical protein KC727_02990 [Candidatus Kaiserbacteria bacterium]|nr:hypothetical protein [Candidatus Kaiserbacteria bacterium]